MKIYILGSTGMLGRYVSKHFKTKHTTIEISRNNLNVADLNEEQLQFKLLDFGVTSSDVIINCIGAIKPTVDSLGEVNAIKINSIFPRILANVAEKLNVKLIHPTTDCVFTGKKGLYTEEDIHDISDVYGRTKSLGESKNCTVIRTSIIGEEVNQGRSLIEWIKSQNNKTVNGFTNHLWNGVTCLQFAKICEQIINNDLFWNGVKHVFSNIVSKDELLRLVVDQYQLNIHVNSVKAPETCDRTLSSVSDFYKQFNVPSLKQQILELKEFSNQLYLE